MLIFRYFSLSLVFFHVQTDDNDAIHVISVGDQPTMEKPPEYDTVVILDPPCYDEAIKLNPANLLQTKYYQDILLPNYADLDISGSINMSNCGDLSTNDDSCRRQQQNDAAATTTPSSGNSSSSNSNNNHSNSSYSSSISHIISSNESNENVLSSHSPSTVITIEQTASDFSNEYSNRQKSNDDESVAANESTAMR